MRASLWLIVGLMSSMLGAAQSSESHTHSKTDRILIQELVISGVTTVDSQQLTEIEHSLTALEVKNDDSEIKERLRDAFQQRGYFDAEVKTLETKQLDPLARPAPVHVDAEVNEGLRYKIAGIQFVNNHVLTAQKLQAQFPLQRGDFFSTDKVRGGIESLRKLYTSMGYLSFVAVPDAEERSNAGVILRLDLKEGSQYRMGKLEILGEKEATDQLQRKWALGPGKPFDAGYLRKFVEENKSLLPDGFVEASNTNVSVDCKELTASVQIQVDPKQPLQRIPSKVDCDNQKADPASGKKPQS